VLKLAYSTVHLNKFVEVIPALPTQGEGTGKVEEVKFRKGRRGEERGKGSSWSELKGMVLIDPLSVITQLWD